MGTYEKPVHDICVDKTSCRHELTAEGKPAKGPGPGAPPGGQGSRPAADICVDKTSCRHELTADGKPLKGPVPGAPPGGGQSQGAAAGEAVKASGQSRDKPPAGGSQQGS